MVQRVTGSAGAAALECVNPRKDRWAVRWDIVEKDGGTAEYCEAGFDGKPTEEDIMRTITSHINGETDAAILRGFKWKGQAVYLSTENQLNFAAIERNGAINYPLTVKVNETEEGEAEYATFGSREAFAEFSQAASLYIIETVQEGWRRKDKIDVGQFKL